MAETARSTPGRLHGLLAAHHLITSDLRLSATLERVVRASCDLVAALGTRGAVLLTRTRGHDPFELRDIELATTFAAQVAVALRFDDARVDAQRLRMFEDRDVVAQDLNYNVMQRLFATAVLRTFNPRVRRRGQAPYPT